MNKIIPQNFDWEFYLSIYPDLIKNGINTERLAKRHYMLYGQYENRQYCLPSLIKSHKINTDIKKIIINAYHNDSSSGIGDFLRGCIYIHELSQKFNFVAQIDFSNHSISKYIKSSYEQKIDKAKIKDIYYETIKKYSQNYSIHDLKERFDHILNLQEKKTYVSSMYSDNLFLTPNQSMKDNFEKYKAEKTTRDFMKSNLLFSDEIENFSKEILQQYAVEPNKYNVIHLRLGDFKTMNKQMSVEDEKILNQINFKNYKFDENQIISDIKKIAKKNQYTTILMSDSNDFKEYINSQKINNIIVMHTKSNHCSPAPGLIAHSEYRNTVKDEQLKYVALDLKLMSMAKKIYSFSVYPWGSGFSFSIAKIYDIPLKIDIIGND